MDVREKLIALIDDHTCDGSFCRGKTERESIVDWLRQPAEEDKS